MEHHDEETALRQQQTRMLIGAAIAVPVLGTAWMDPSRLLLFAIPLTFLPAAYEAGRLLHRLAQSCRFGGRVPPLGLPAVRVGVGIAALSLLAFTLGLLGWLPYGMGVIAGLLVSAVVRLRTAGCSVLVACSAPAALVAGSVTGLGWLLAWLWATTPPVFFDELSYHLVVPERALTTGTLPVFPWVFFTLMPHASDVLLAWGMGIGKLLDGVHAMPGGGDLGARAMVWTLWVACSFIAWGLFSILVWPRWSVWSAPLVTLALASAPTLWFIATLPFGETCAAIGVLTAAALLAGRVRCASDVESPPPWLFLGLVLGLVGTVKLTGVYWIAALLAAAVIAGWNWSALLRTGLVAAVSVAPWWGRAFVHTGNPVYPMAYNFLGGRFWNAENQARVMGDVATRWTDLGLGGLLRLPWELVWHPERFGSGADVGGPAVVAGCLAVVLPALARGVGARPSNRRLADMAGAFVVVAGVGWLLTSTVTRFFAPAFMMSLIGLAAVICSRGVRPRVGAALVLVVAGLWGTSRFVSEHTGVFSSWDVALGREARDSYLARQVDHFAAARFVREQLPPTATLLFIGETRPYYFARPALAPTAYDTHPLSQWVMEAASAKALAGRLSTEGISHVVLNVREFKRLHDSYGLLAFEKSGDQASEQRLRDLPAELNLLFSAKGVYVFEVPTAQAAARALDPSRG